MILPDMLLINKENYPTIFKAIEILSHDTGNQAGHTNYAVSLKWKDNLEVLEETLSNLSDESLSIICIGEDGERNELIRKSIYLSMCDDFLQDVFD